MIKEISVKTKNRYELIDLTPELEEFLEENSVKSGLLFLFVPHSTAALLLTENEEGLKQDWLEFFKKITAGIDFRHNQIDDNAVAHLLSGLVGQGRVLAIENGKLVRGIWQNIFLVELDGPRTRRLVIKIIKDSN